MEPYCDNRGSSSPAAVGWPPRTNVRVRPPGAFVRSIRKVNGLVRPCPAMSVLQQR